MTETYELPFDLDAEAVDSWLNSIDRLSPTEKMNMLNPVLSQLNNAVVGVEILVPILDKLASVVLMLSNLIEKMALNEGCASEKGKKWLAAAIRLPKKLSLAYAKVALDNAAPSPIRALCIVNAMQIMAVLIKRNALAYEVPDAGLWKSLAELHVSAVTSKSLMLPIDQTISDLNGYPTAAEAIVKHILLFHSCLPGDFSQESIASAFCISDELSQWVNIKNEPSDYALCRWNPASATLPNTDNGDNAVEEQALYLDCFELIDYFDHHPEYWDKYRKFAVMFDRMTAYYDIRRSVNPSHTRKCGLIIGSKQAEKFLNVLISRYRILELSEALHDKQSPSKLELVPMETGNKLMATLTTKILSDDKSFAASRLSVYETDHADFCVAKIGNLPCSLNEPVILAYEGQQPCFGIIRYLRVEANVNLKNLLIERITGAVYPLEIDGIQAFIVLRPTARGPELFLPSGQSHTNQTVLKTAKGVINKAFVIKKFLEMNAHFSRYHVSFS